MPTKIMLFARILLGLIFLVFGLNGFFHFIPAQLSTAGSEYMTGFVQTPFYILLKATEVITSLLLLVNFFTPLALIILAPISINILVFHIFYEAKTIPLAIAIIILQLLVAYGRKDCFKPLLRK